MPPKFGTSGLRGLVIELTEALVRDYMRAFIAACPTGSAIHVGQDLRPSSPQIAAWVLDEVQAAGLVAVDCGALPTPALALSAMDAGGAAVMVTGSHIPADRNGLKFYVPSGEISKADEDAILAALGAGAPVGTRGSIDRREASDDYIRRYLSAFGPALDGLRVGVYQHSSVARDIMAEVIQGLGAEAIPIARSDVFIPVDTEALDPDTQALFAGWFAEHALDVLISTDGDADRPMVVDDAGRVVPGDVLGALTARMLGAEVICTPVSSNTMIDEAYGIGFQQIQRTRIGSPYVIAAMEEALAQDSAAKVVGYEANGGFLLGFTATGPKGKLAPLMTRDCLLPIIAPLVAARQAACDLSALVDALPPRFTAADRLQGVEPDRARALIAQLTEDAAARAAFFAEVGPEQSLDLTDGLRVTFVNGVIVHLRPSGNAPEFRCYAEAGSRDRAAGLVQSFLSKLGAALA
ncbi:phosphomannomutase [Tropicibacter naphthalenivorans]|uniref:Phosphoglucosamine mutase n=1 Tax=Tropicibacter naphthalenivorans TaxID=441103 RepID=A0A0P1GZ12_9RHOB|nr:phosphomannomutase [Tropicibacter naphthalenivorans]CUH82340.1 Phosphoglucosamine mutase [Tropicibacter naphthalenivorans]SMD05670.1 phosphomannomutase [Tropicibacter naphthalenivorans]